MNRRVGPYHNMWTTRSLKLNGTTDSVRVCERPAESGYTLVALLALMAVVALFAMAVAPAIRQQAQREGELETIFRGEEVAEAIRIYYSARVRTRNLTGDSALPTSIDQLLEGIPSGTKKVQILRASAARNPLSASGEWNLIRPRSTQLTDFQRSVMLFTDNVKPTTNDPQLKQAEQLLALTVLPTLGISPTGSSSTSADNSDGPFIGVVPESKNKSVINYYGIDRHDGWIFTPLFR